MWKNSLQKISIKMISDLWMFHTNKSRWLTCVSNGPWQGVSQQYITFFTVYNNTESQWDDTLYKKNSIVQTIHLASVFSVFSSFFFFLFSFSYKIVQNYSPSTEDFANPKKKSVLFNSSVPSLGTAWHVKILYEGKSFPPPSLRFIHQIFKALHCTKGVNCPNFWISSLTACVLKPTQQRNHLSA